MDLKTCCEIVFLALTVWREARGCPHRETRVAVAATVLNRVDKPCWWGNSILSVIFKKWQYSSLTDPKDKQLTTWPQTYDGSWKECLQIAFAVINGTEKTTMPGADSYYDTSIRAPKWATKETLVGQIDNIVFHNTDHDYELLGR